MFTDIVGYTALMEENEATAALVRNRHRKVFQEQHEIFHGEIVQYFGDGSLSVFKSAIEAVQCAIDIQKKLKEADPVPLRIGLHMGDIVFDKTEVYGDGVNIASRIESMAVAGAILLSGKINDELKNHKEITTTLMELFELKNVAKPVEVFAVTNKGITVPALSDLKGKQRLLSKTIAVLPFINMSTSEDNEYFSDGITEEIINALAKVSSLKVTSRTSSFFFKNKTISIKEIANELGVSVILEGSVRQAGNTLRITAQLIQAEDDFHFWSDTWDRKMESIFEIQDEISLIIADKLREQFGHFEIQDHLVEKQTESIDAYEYCLKAKFYEKKWKSEDTKMAISLYEKALALDSNYADAHLGLAECYSFLGTTTAIPFEEGWAKTIDHTNQALALDGQSSGVHYQLSNQAFFIETDYNKALKEAKKAIALGPNNAVAQQNISFLYTLAGDREKSSLHLEIARSINPLSEETHFFRGYHHYMIEDYLQSLKMMDQCLSANDKNIPAHSIKATCLLQLGRYEEVINYFDGIPAEVIILGEKTGIVGLAHALKKDTLNASIYLEKLITQSKEEDGFAADSYLFMMYVVMGDLDKAFEWVAQALENHSFLLFLRYVDPIVNPLKKDGRHDAFKKKIFRTDELVSPVKKKTALISATKSSEYSARLLEYLSVNKPFLNPDLSLRELASQVDIHPNHLSWLLNNNFGKNYNEFINQYRIEAFKLNAKASKNANLTIEGLAYESGFNSKTVFNTYFKKETGLTPKQFMKQ
jgi:TolB-like protein/AraC-like DNA-binding protein/thioredoxin-like negative regulator of GroEL